VPLGFPETPGRLRVLLDHLEANAGPWTVDRSWDPASEDDTLGVVRWLHEEEYVRRFRTAVAAAPGQLDGPDTPVSQGTFRAAATAAGVAVRASMELVNGRLDRAFLAIRPPGHHALPHRAMGFCFFNNAALAAEIVARAWQVPVLIVDFDVHHGNGTQAIFWERADVGYLSIHRHPFYPGTGTADETGSGRGAGTTRNIPLAEGAGDDLFASAVEAGLEELGGRLRPAVIVVSAGFDAHMDDPVGGLGVSEEGFRRIGQTLTQAAEAWAGGRILALLEGGYHPGATARSATAWIEGLAGATGTGRTDSIH